MNIFLAGFCVSTDSKQMTVFFTKRTPSVLFVSYNAAAVWESARPGQAFEWKVKKYGNRDCSLKARKTYRRA